MAKKEKSVAPVMSAIEMLAKLKREREELLAKLAAQESEIAEKAKAEEAERLEKLNALIAETLESAKAFGVEDINALRNVVATYAKHGTVAPAMGSKVSVSSGAGVGKGGRYDEATKERAIEQMRGGKPVSVIEKEMNIPAPTLNVWKKEAGLVKSRTAETATVPTTEATA